MVLRFIQSILTGDKGEVINQGALEESKRRKESKLVDLAEEALRDEAASKSSDLKGIVNRGRSNLEREKFKRSKRKNIWSIVTRSLGISDDEMVDEITEKITEVAESDPYYGKVFGKDAK